MIWIVVERDFFFDAGSKIKWKSVLFGVLLQYFAIFFLLFFWNIIFKTVTVVAKKKTNKNVNVNQNL